MKFMKRGWELRDKIYMPNGKLVPRFSTLGIANRAYERTRPDSNHQAREVLMKFARDAENIFSFFADRKAKDSKEQ